MSFFYTREPGPEGQILTGEGPAPGVVLSELLRRGPLPVKAALELVAYCADILTIAEEDGITHGDIKPALVTVDEGGAVSIAGWGETRKSSRAPEPQSAGSATDVYGIGVVLHGVLATEPLGEVPRDRDAHDDTIVDRLMQVDWQDLQDKRWMDEVLHFLCSMLAFDPVERPVPLDVANVIGHVSMQAPGEDLGTWAERMVGEDRGGARPPFFQDPLDAPLPHHLMHDDEEDLGGPVALGTPVSATSALKLRQAASAKGEATAFWSRERIQELLADDEDEPVRTRFDPSKSRGRKPSDISEELPPTPDSTVSGMPSPLPPKPKQIGPGIAPPPPPRPEGRPSQVFAQPVADTDLNASTTRLPGSRPPEEPQWGAAPPAPPPGQPPVSPFASVGGAASATYEEEPVPPAKPRSNALKIALGVMAAMVFLCGGLSVVGAALWYFTQHEEEVVPSPVDADASGTASPEEAPAPTPAPQDTGAPADDAKPEEGDKEDVATAPAKAEPPRPPPSSPSSSRSTPTTSDRSRTERSPSGSDPSASSRRGSTGSSSTPPPSTSRTPPPSTSAPPSAPATGGGLPAMVRFTNRSAETTLECSPGGRRTFSGSTSFEIDTVTTCRVLADGKMTAVQMRKGGEVNCSITGDRLVCTGP